MPGATGTRYSDPSGPDAVRAALPCCQYSPVVVQPPPGSAAAFACLGDRVEKVALDALDQREILDEKDDLLLASEQPADFEERLVDPADPEVGRLHHRDVAFHDVTTGHNTVAFPPTTIKGYATSRGWDAVTGWGSPDASVLVPLLTRDVHDGDAKGL